MTNRNSNRSREWIIREWARPGAILGVLVTISLQFAASLRGAPFLAADLPLLLALAVVVGWIVGYIVGGLIRKFILRDELE